MTAGAALLAGLAVAAASPVTPREARPFLGRGLQEVRLRDLHGVVRIRLSGGETLEDADGPYLLLRYQVRNARDRDAEIPGRLLEVRTPDGTWLRALGVAAFPPPAMHPYRPALASREPVRVPRDQTWPLYAAFRTGLAPDDVDAAVVFRDRPHFLRRPLRASRAVLVEDALAALEAGQTAFAAGLLEEGARAGERARLDIGARLLARARALRASDRPVEEDRILRLALPFAPNPAFVHSRLAELRERARRRYPAESYRRAPRDWRYHRRRARAYEVPREAPPVPTRSPR